MRSCRSAPSRGRGPARGFCAATPSARASELATAPARTRVTLQPNASGHHLQQGAARLPAAQTRCLRTYARLSAGRPLDRRRRSTAVTARPSRAAAGKRPHWRPSVTRRDETAPSGCQGGFARMTSAGRTRRPRTNAECTAAFGNPTEGRTRAHEARRSTFPDADCRAWG